MARRRVMPETGWYADEFEFIEKLSRHVDKASKFGDMSQSISTGHEVRIRAMRATLRGVERGDTLVFAHCQWEALRRGDVILIRVGQKALARRLVRPTFDGKKYVFLTKSDYASDLDPPIEPEYVMGRLVAVEREGRTLPARQFRGGFFYLFTECGTRSAIEKLLDMLLILVPKGLRPTTWYRMVRARRARRGLASR